MRGSRIASTAAVDIVSRFTPSAHAAARAVACGPAPPASAVENTRPITPTPSDELTCCAVEITVG